MISEISSPISPRVTVSDSYDFSGNITSYFKMLAQIFNVKRLAKFSWEARYACIVKIGD
jgi:hypothetical protein